MTTATAPRIKAAPAYAVLTSAIHAKFAAWVEKSGLSNREIGKRLGFPDGTAVSKYLNNKYDRADAADIEKRILDLLHKESQRRVLAGHTIQTSVMRQVEKFADTITKTNTVGVLHSPAGMGKTTAIRRYATNHPTAVLLVANASQCDATGMRQLLWASIDHNGYRGITPRWTYLVEKFRNSGRLIIIDNAQRLSSTGRDFLFDFRDATDCPLLLVGNPIIKERVASNDQQFSRTLMEHEATLKDHKDVARELIAQYTPHVDTIIDLAVPVIRKAGGGHLRALSMTLTAMEEFLAMPTFAGDPRRAFESALAKSIHHS